MSALPATALTSLLGTVAPPVKGFFAELINRSKDKLVEIHINKDLNVCSKDDPDRVHSWSISNGMVLGGSILALLAWSAWQWTVYYNQKRSKDEGKDDWWVYLFPWSTAARIAGVL